MLPPLIPVLAVALAYPLWQLGLLISMFYFAAGLGQAPIGILSDRYDRRYILPTGIGLSGFAYVLFASAPVTGEPIPNVTVIGNVFEGGFIVMSISMAIVGAGIAAVHPTTYPLITVNISEENKGKVLGAFGSSAKLGDAMAPAIIAVLILVLVWSWILVLLGFSVVAFAAALYVMLGSDEIKTLPEERKTDSKAGENTSDSLLSADKREYIYPLTVMYSFFVTKMFAANGINTFIPVFLVSVYAYSFNVANVSLGPESFANIYFSALLLSAAVSQLFLGPLSDKRDPREVILGGMIVATIALTVLSIFELSPVTLLLVMLVIGGSLWGTNPARDALVSEISPPGREGRTFGYLWTAVQLTGSVMPVFIGYFLESAGMREGFLMLAAGTGLGAVSVSLLYVNRIYLADPDSGVTVESSD